MIGQNEYMDVLLIEDEQKIADFVITGFATANITVHHELDGFRGLNTALIKTFDAIVLDVGLPLLDGFQVIQEYRRKEFTTPVIMLTARTELDDRLKVFQSGADDYMSKPFLSKSWSFGYKPSYNAKSAVLKKPLNKAVFCWTALHV